MKPIKQSYRDDELSVLPSLSTTPDYKIVRGDPRASIHYEIDDSETGQALGIWRCTEGAFECTEKANELQTVISGKLRLTGEDGNTIELNPGDSVYTQQGEKVIWDIVEDVTKVFFNVKTDN